MIRQKYVNAVCCVLIVFAMLLTGLVTMGVSSGVIETGTQIGYENRLFDTERVHTINIVMDDWDGFLETCTDEEYVSCSVIIDNEAYSNVGLRAKGNTSLSNVANYGNDRYSFKLEFDHYDSGKTYYGLDKLSLNNIIQDNTYMKDFVTYQMMNAFGVNAPLCSYAQILVNGQEWGLYLAVEGVEDSFLARTASADTNLYKPDSMSMGGGRGQGKEFHMSQWNAQNESSDDQSADKAQNETQSDTQSDTQNAPQNNMQAPAMPEGMNNADTAPDAQSSATQNANSNTDSTQDSQPSMDPGQFGQNQNGAMSAPDGQGFGMDDSMAQGMEQNGGAMMQPGQMSPPDGSGMPQAMPDQSGQMPDASVPAGQMPAAENDTDTADSSASEDASQQDTSSNPFGQMPGGAMQGGQAPDMGGMDNGMGGGMGMMGSSDVSLIYTDDEVSSYSNIFDSAKTDITEADQTRLIESLKKLNSQEDLEDVVDIDQVIRYFVVHNFVVNFDSYTGSMIHNYYLSETDGRLAMIPWDYNLAFGGFQSQSDATSLVNYSIDNPVSGGSIDSRPMLAWIFSSDENTALYHQYFQEFIDSLFGSDQIPSWLESIQEMIAPYVESDPTKFCTSEEFETGASTLVEFLRLRAQSVQGQLDGSISSTSAQSDAAAIDASSLSISAMGSMNGGGMSQPDMAGGMNGDQMPQMDGAQGNEANFQPFNAQQMPEADSTQQSANSSEDTAQNSTAQNDAQPSADSAQPAFDGQMPMGQGNPMGQNNPMGQDAGAGQMQPPSMPDAQEDSSEQSASQADGQNQPGQKGDFDQQRPDMEFGQMNGQQPGQGTAISTQTWIVLAASLLVLAAGLAIAILYKRKA